MTNQANARFLVLSYHYIRPPKEKDLFPRILGNLISDFTDQVKKLAREYPPISPEEVRDIYYSGKTKGLEKTGLLFTLDDGLSDHYLAAKILHDFGIRALFFIPTCILTDGKPANPMIIHYCLAKYGITVFLGVFNETVKKFGIECSVPNYVRGDNVWEKIAEIKKTVKYGLGAEDSRKILLYIYENTLSRDYKNALEIIHLTQGQIREMIAMGHSIGSHTHTHVSVAAADLTKEEINRELVSSKQILEKLFGVEVRAFSYPFGEPADCLFARNLLALTKDYDLAFTIEEKINTEKTSPLELGRYMPTSKDTTDDVCLKLNQISKNSN